MHAMKIRLAHALLLVLFLSLATGAVEAGAARLALAPGDPAPQLHGNRPDNVLVRVDFTAHKLTLLNFWASWCEPCKAEMPELQRLWEQHRDQGFEVIGAFQDVDDLDLMRQLAEDLGVSYTVIRPRSRFRSLWGGGGVLPLSYLVDDKGKILRRYVGATPEQIEGLRFDVGELLEGRQMGPLVMPTEPAVSDGPKPSPQQGSY